MDNDTLARIEQKIDRNYYLLRALQLGEDIMATDLDRLEADVTAQGTVIGSAITLLNGLKKSLDDAIASGDPKRVKAVADSIEAQKDALAAAVVANTPGAPP